MMQPRLTQDQQDTLVSLIRNKKTDMPDFVIENCHLFTRFAKAIKCVRREKNPVFALAVKSTMSLFTASQEQNCYFVVRIHAKPKNQDLPRSIFYVAVSKELKHFLVNNLYEANPDKVIRVNSNPTDVEN